jgi:hypothetical protein
MTEGDGKSKVTFTWRAGDISYDKILCTYQGAGVGVTSIILDGKTVL